MNTLRMGKPKAVEDGMDSMGKGRHRYAKGDYAGALEAFTEAVQYSSQHLLLNALDARAATYEKLGDLQPALRDAKKMIDEMPKLSKGYLRCGKVLRLLQKPELALRIYDRGLTKVKIGADDDRIKLQSVYNQLRIAQTPGKSRDPLEYLPLELAEMVCLNLSMRDRVVCLSVTHSWKRLLESSHKLWTTLDTSHVKKVISQKSLTVHFRRSKWTLDRALLSIKSVDAQRLAYITKHCKMLKEIQMYGRGMIGDSLTSALNDAISLETLYVSRNTEMTLAAVQSALRLCKATLVTATILKITGPRGGFLAGKWSEMGSIKSLHLESDGESVLDIHGLAASTPIATSITLSNWGNLPNLVDCTPWTKLEHLDLTNTQLRRLPKLPTSLKSLNLSNNIQLHVGVGDEAPAELPLLETFNCEGTFITPDALKVLTMPAIANGKLKSLLIGARLADARPGPATDEYPASEDLEELSLNTMQINDARVLQILELYPKLRKLDVSGTRVTGVAVRKFVNWGITSLNLDECIDVSSDAVDWARNKGVEVEFNFNRKDSRMSFWSSSFAQRFA
ncbi:hypothetical protein N431DRAFT_542865 [Stipitochalara longipes BDJ]|nr:hypothetical protein N431DRAFT_542865 [Stipitochalara longipes BDJ]